MTPGPFTAVRWRWIVASVLLAAWCASLILPAVAITFDRGAGPVTFNGWQVLRSGWMDVFALQFGWGANPALVAVLLLLVLDPPRPWLLRIAGAAVFLCALHSIDLFLRPDFYGMAGAYAGYFLWMVVMAGAGAAALFASMDKAMDTR